MGKIEERKVETEKRAKDPQPGHYWQENLMPILIVLERNGNEVVFCDQVKTVGDSHWSWDFDQVKTVTVEEFEERLRYKTFDGYWADSFGALHVDVIAYYKEHYGKEGKTMETLTVLNKSPDHAAELYFRGEFIEVPWRILSAGDLVRIRSGAGRYHHTTVAVERGLQGAPTLAYCVASSSYVVDGIEAIDVENKIIDVAEE